MGRIVGAAVPPFWGAGFPSKTMSPGPRPISLASGILIHLAVWPEQTWAENLGLCLPFWGRRVGSPSNTVTEKTGQTGQTRSEPFYKRWPYLGTATAMTGKRSKNNERYIAKISNVAKIRRVIELNNTSPCQRHAGD